MSGVSPESLMQEVGKERFPRRYSMFVWVFAIVVVVVAHL